jgi:glucose-1-phosphate thymidylyltransferase
LFVEMEIAKAVIVAGTAGDEDKWPAVGAGPRHLFPIANRPILFHALESLRGGGLLEATIVAEPDALDAIRGAVGDGRRWDLTIRHRARTMRDGLAGTLDACRSFIGDEPVLVQHADALLRGKLHPHIATFCQERLDAMALRVAPGHGGEAVDELPPSYLLSPRAMSLLMQHPDAAADPIGEVHASGGTVRVQPVEGCLPCHGDLDALLDSNRRVLEGLERRIEEASLDGCEIQGPVVAHATASIRRSVLRGPAIIGPRARITDAYVGPYTSIGSGVTIEGAEIEYSIVLPGAEIAYVGARIESSVIGERARVARAFRRPSSIRMSIGQHAEVIL